MSTSKSGEKIWVRFNFCDDEELVTLCDHIKIEATLTTEKDSGHAEYEEWTTIHCAVCDEKFEIVIAVN